MTWWSGAACVVFDLDDTVYLERDYVRSGFAAVGSWAEEALAATGFGRCCWELFCSGVRHRTFDEALHRLGVGGDAALVRDLVNRYRSHVPDIALLADARRAIATLQADGVAVGVLTDGPLESQRAKATALGTADWAQRVVFTDELGPSATKPSPAGFIRLQQSFGVAARECIYVGDNPHKDFGGPATLGWRTVRVRRPGALHVDVPSGADVAVEVVELGTSLTPALDPQ